jgi:hypothetical protein
VRLLLKISRCSEDRQARVFQFRADKNGTRASSSSARFITFIHKSTQNSHVKPSHAIHRTRPLRRCQIVLTTISTTISPSMFGYTTSHTGDSPHQFGVRWTTDRMFGATTPAALPSRFASGRLLGRRCVKQHDSMIGS